MDDQDRLVGKWEEKNTWMERKLEEVMEELEALKRDLWEVYKRLNDRLQEALDMPTATPPPTTIMMSTQTEVAPSAPAAMLPALNPPTPPVLTTAFTCQWGDAPMVEGPTKPSGEEMAPPPALDTQTLPPHPLHSHTSTHD